MNLKDNQTEVTSTDVKLLMSNLLTDLNQKAPAHPKWVIIGTDKGLEVGEYQ